MAKKVADLAAYRRKRNFAVTKEPRGGRAAGSRLFVIQKHAASRLHYDFRLELDGTLKSWAVPKGPSVDPSAKRLAVHVEDHPIEYGSFEGVIPKGEYGGGTVMLWDRGRWEPVGDARSSYRKGRLKFRLHGEKLRGIWNLVRMTGPASEDGKNWLLIKDRDDDAGGNEPTESKEKSVATGRSMDSIARGRVRRPNAPEAHRGKAPSGFSPQLATLASEAPEGDDWLHEIKLDGYRILAFVAGGRVRLQSRNGLDWSARFPQVVRAVHKLPMKDAVIDGEVVALRPDGTSDFQQLQNVMRSKEPANIAYFAFDLPFYAGNDLRALPLAERKSVLAGLLAGAGSGVVRFSEHFRGDGENVLKHACGLGLEGIVSKRADAPYESRRSATWLKVKCSSRQEFIIAGWTDPRGARHGFGSLLLAHHDAEGRLVYSGKVGTGFNNALLAGLSRRLRAIERRSHPLDLPPPQSQTRGAHWVRPAIVVEIEFTEWTKDGRLRHPSFVGLREDKAPAKVVREIPRKGATPAPRYGARLTHPDRVLWPDAKITKAGLAAYYESVAGLMLPHVVGRPLAIVRCPEGLGSPCFFQKHPSSKTSEHLTVEDLDGLISLVQMGALEIHPWGAATERLDRPDRLIFDLDPGPGVTWAHVVEGALAIRDRLAAAELRSFVRTSGGKGLHVVSPLARRTSWDDLKSFARGVAEELAHDRPARYVAAAAKSRRRGRIFIDWLRNGEGATAVASYSTRARPGAPVATPLRWDELAAIGGGDAFTVASMAKRLAEAGDAWPDFFSLKQSIAASAIRSVSRGPASARGA
jgi:bifunctional non-homologous end joining protein LigD